MKKVVSTRSAPGRHWVGDGFPVHGMFGYDEGARERSPFLMLDYAAPMRFEPTSARRGVGTHPHRGFETVTIVYAGEVEHRDSTGKGGVIGPGDVQWMTAGSGILHEEFHSTNYAKAGGPFEMVQLWVNLPAKDKMTAPGYQAILNSDIPSIALRDSNDAEAGRVRVIAGSFDGRRGPAHTFTPMNVWDVRVQAGRTVTLPVPEGWPVQLIVLDGTVQVNGDHVPPSSVRSLPPEVTVPPSERPGGGTVLRATQMASLSTEGEGLQVEANGDAKLLVLAGEPIDEPVVGYGPFVMNTRAEIEQAIHDFNAGKFGRMN